MLSAWSLLLIHVATFKKKKPVDALVFSSFQNCVGRSLGHCKLPLVCWMSGWMAEYCGVGVSGNVGENKIGLQISAPVLETKSTLICQVCSVSTLVAPWLILVWGCHFLSTSSTGMSEIARSIGCIPLHWFTHFLSKLTVSDMQQWAARLAN